MSARDERSPPRTTPVSAPYWAGCASGELRLQHCNDCGHVQFPPRVHCTACRGPRLEWRPASGQGRVESFTWVHVPVDEAWAQEVPYAVALVRLAEGPRMMSNLRDCRPGEVAIGDAVAVCFERRGDDLHVPQFRRVRDA